MVLQKMTKVQIIGPKEDLGGVVDLLYRLGTIHLEDARQAGIHGDAVRRMEAGRGEELSQLLVRVGAVLQALPTLPEDRPAQAALVADLRQKNDSELARKAAEVISQLETRKEAAGLIEAARKEAEEIISRAEKEATGSTEEYTRQERARIAQEVAETRRREMDRVKEAEAAVEKNVEEAVELIVRAVLPE